MESPAYSEIKEMLRKTNCSECVATGYESAGCSRCVASRISAILVEHFVREQGCRFNSNPEGHCKNPEEESCVRCMAGEFITLMRGVHI